MATCSADTILSQACSNGFKQLVETNPNLAQAVLNQILCNLVAGGGSGGASGIATGEGSPITGGVSTITNRIYIDDTDPANPEIWVVSNGSWVQVIN